MFFPRDSLKERALLLHKVYLNHFRYHGLGFVSPLTRNDVYQITANAYYRTEPTTFNHDASDRKVKKAVNRRLRTHTPSEFNRRVLIDTKIVECLVDKTAEHIPNLKLDKSYSQQQILLDFYEQCRISGLHRTIPSKQGVPTTAPFDDSVLSRGVAYSGGCREFLSAALNLNEKVLNNGSIWCVGSVDAWTIRNELIKVGVHYNDVVLYRDKDIKSNALFYFEWAGVDCLFEILAPIIHSKFKDVVAGDSIKIDRVLVMFLCVTRYFALKGGDKHGSVKSSDLTLASIIDNKTEIFGQDSMPLDAFQSCMIDLRVPSNNEFLVPFHHEHWDSLMSDVYRVLDLLNLNSDKISSGVVVPFGSFYTDGKAHVFESVHLRYLVLNHYKMYSLFEKGQRPRDRSLVIPMFVEQTEYVVCGLGVMGICHPRGFDVALNTFWLDKECCDVRFDEELVSSFANSSTRVMSSTLTTKTNEFFSTRFLDGQSFGVDDWFTPLNRYVIT